MTVVTQQDYSRQTSGNIKLIPQSELMTTWPLVVHLFEQGEEYYRGYYTLEDIYIAILEGTFQLWIGIDKGEIFAAGLTTIDKYPQCIVVRMLFLSGARANTMLELSTEIEHWAAMLGVKKSEIIGRDAWERLAKPHGYVKRSVVLTKELVNIPNVPQSRRH